MYLRATSIVIAALLLVPRVLPGQQVDPSVYAIDPTVNSRVQDIDFPASALLPGGSAAWTGQPIMSQTPSLPPQRIKVNQFPSLVGASTWGRPTSSGASLPSNVSATGASAWTGQPIMTQAPSVRAQTGRVSQFPSLASVSTWGPTSPASATDSSAPNAAGVPDRARGGLLSTKTARSRKLNMTTATVDLYSAKSISSQDEFAAGVKLQTRTGAALELRKVRQETAQSARARITNPLRASADAATAGRWHSDQSSARALAQQEHEAGLLLHYGFDARKTRSWHRRKVHTPGEKY
jgi:hypothetical protein